MIEDVDRSQSYPGLPVIHVRMRVSVPCGAVVCACVCAFVCVCRCGVRESHSVSACVLCFRAFGLVSVSFAFRFRACVRGDPFVVTVLASISCKSVCDGSAPRRVSATGLQRRLRSTNK